MKRQVSALSRLLVLATLALCMWVPPASGAKADAKAIWGPVSINGRSEFPVYHKLGVGIFQTSLIWPSVATTAPRDARNPKDPAYHWPAEVTQAIQQAARYHIRVLLLVQNTPDWANGGLGGTYPPSDPNALADFVTAAARRYPSVHLWMIWGEPNRQPQFGLDQPVAPGATQLTLDQAAGPHAYASLLDASYGALKAISSKNLIIGGDTFTTGDISTSQWIENLRLPNGQPPRMDIYGHNPFSWRPPNLANPPSPDGQVDFSDLARLSQLVNASLAVPGQRIKLLLSEWSIPTAANDDEFNYFVSPTEQAQWITDAWSIVRASTFIYALGWIHVYDDAPGPGSSSGGLFDSNGQPKPGYYAFKAG